jgi:hypothetical protein
VDTGLLRLGEGDQVMETFAKHMGVKVDRVNASEEFYRELKGVEDPSRNARSSAGSSSRCSSARRRSCPRPSGWRRARSTPT